MGLLTGNSLLWGWLHFYVKMASSGIFLGLFCYLGFRVLYLLT